MQLLGVVAVGLLHEESSHYFVRVFRAWGPALSCSMRNADPLTSESGNWKTHFASDIVPLDGGSRLALQASFHHEGDSHVFTRAVRNMITVEVVASRGPEPEAFLSHVRGCVWDRLQHVATVRGLEGRDMAL